MERAKLPSIHLFKVEGSANKQYKVELLEQCGGFIVNGWNGGIGKPLKIQPKTPSPVSYEEALKIFEKLVTTKKKDGYTENEDGKSYAVSVNAGAASGNRPQLLNPIEKSELQSYIDDDSYGLQFKADGERLMTEKKPDSSIVPSNRLGMIININSQVVTDLAGHAASTFTLDGENLDDTFAVFDLLELNGESLRELGFQKRHEILSGLGLSGSIHVLPLAVGRESKIAFLAELEARAAAGEYIEGFVFKKLNAPYEPGRPNSGGPQLKFVHYEVSTCIVIGNNGQKGKRSVQLGLLDRDGNVKPVGNVTVPVNAEVPAVGSLLDVRYRHLYENGSLFTTVYVRPRTDILREDCTLAQVRRVKKKRSGAEEDSEE